MAWVKTLIGRCKEGINYLSTDASGQLLLSASLDGVAFLWNINNRKIVTSTSKGIGSLKAVALSPDGRYAALVPSELIFNTSSSGVTVSVNTRLWLWDCGKSGAIDQLDFNNFHPYSVCFVPDKKNILAIGGPGGVKFFDIHHNCEVGIAECSNSAHSIVISPDGRWLASSSRCDAKVHFWDLSHLGKSSVLEGHDTKGGIGLAFVGRHDQLATYAADKQLIFWDLKQKKQIHTLKLNYAPTSNVAISPDGSLLAISSEFWASILDREGNEIKKIQMLGYIYDLIFSPVSNTLYIARGIGEITQWRYEPSQDERARQVFTSPDWIHHAAIYYRKLGFFQSLADIPDSEFPERLIAGRPFQSSPTEFELVCLLALDHRRVWWDDMECVYEDDIYTETLTQWAEISLGSFQPHNISETWDWQNQTVEISFENQGQVHTIHPEVSLDWFDLSILDEINKIISETGYQFEVFAEPHDQTAIVICLTPEEKKKLGVDLGITFQY